MTTYYLLQIFDKHISTRFDERINLLFYFKEWNNNWSIQRFDKLQGTSKVERVIAMINIRYYNNWAIWLFWLFESVSACDYTTEE